MDDDVHLLGKLCRFHLSLHNLQSDDLASGLVVLESLGLMADGETAFSKGMAGGISALGWVSRCTLHGHSEYAPNSETDVGQVHIITFSGASGSDIV